MGASATFLPPIRPRPRTMASDVLITRILNEIREMSL